MKTPNEISIDGGKARLRTPLGQCCQWRDYKAVNLHGQGVEAFFQDNTGLVQWVKQQPLGNPLVSLGDGHDGVWNLFAEIGQKNQRREILDWYHLIENLEKVGGSSARRTRVKALLWSGQVDEALLEFDDWNHPRVKNLFGISHGCIVTGLSTMAIIRRKGFPLAREMWSQRLNRFRLGFSFQARSGKQPMSPKFSSIALAYLNGIFSQVTEVPPE